MIDSAVFPVMDSEDVVCMDCGRWIPKGAPYSQRAVSITGDGLPITEIVCAFGYCRSPE